MSYSRDLVMPNLSYAVIGERKYEAVQGAVPGLLENKSAHDYVMIHKYRDLDIDKLKARRLLMLSAFFEKSESSKDLEDLEFLFLERINNSKELHSILYPFNYIFEDFGEKVCYSICELPQDFFQNYRRMDEMIENLNISLEQRVMFLLELTEILKMLHGYFKIAIGKLTPEAFYVDVEKLRIKIILEKLFPLSCDSGKEADYFCPECIEEPLCESEYGKFLAYTIFKTLCMANPYDGRRTLTLYPLLSKNAGKEIHSGKYGFIFADVQNKFSDYADKYALESWKRLPSYMRNALIQELQRQENCVENLSENLNSCRSLEQWLKDIRMLKDCVVCVNDQNRFCDPDASNKILFLKVDDYKIPIWANKEIYSYHADMSEYMTQKGVVARIDSEGKIENCSFLQWIVEGESGDFFVKPQEKIKPERNMKLEINTKIFHIVDGENPGG